MKKVLSILFIVALLMSLQIYVMAEEPAEHTHNYSKTLTDVAATCTTPSFTIYGCNVEGCTSTQWGNYGTTLADHSFIANPSQTECTVCGAANPNILTSFAVYPTLINLDLDVTPTAIIEVNTISPTTTDTRITYTSSDPSVISFVGSSVTDAHGSVTIQALKTGSATITATASNACSTKTCLVTVNVSRFITPSPTSVSLSPYPTYTMDVGTTVEFNASVEPSDAPQGLSWVSSDPSVATVSNGHVVALKPGTTTISAITTDLSKNVSTSLTVNDVKVSSITFSQQNLNLNTNGSGSVAYVIDPGNAYNKTLAWTSSDETIATVDSSGTVHGLKAGSVTITATATDGSGKSAYFIATVCSTPATPTPTPSPVPSLIPVATYTTTYYPGTYGTGNVFVQNTTYGWTSNFLGVLFNRTGYTQTGWSLNANGSTRDYMLDQSYVPNGNLVLYPYWTANTQGYKLYLNYDSTYGTVYYNGKVFPSGHYWTINGGESLTLNFVPINNDYYASHVKVGARNISVVNNTCTITYADMRSANQTAYVNWYSIYGKPKTGDDSNITLWAVLLLASGAALGAAIEIKKKSESSAMLVGNL